MEVCVLCYELCETFITLKSSSVLNKSGEEIMKMHFSFINNTQNKLMCLMCWGYLKGFHEFYTKIFDNHESRKNIEHIKIKEEQFVETDVVEENHIETVIKIEYPECDVESTNSKSLDEDEQRIIETANMICDLCSCKLDSFSHAISHFKKTHKIKGYLICCGKKYFRRYRLLTHLNFHYNVIFSCNVCSKNFYSKECLTRHMISHETIRLFQCDKCPKSFAKKFQVRNHLQNVHIYEKVVPSFKCTVENCSKIFVNNLRLQHHLKYTHQGGDQVICEICSKSFKKRTSLEEHMRIHSRRPDERFKCEICGHYIADIRVFERHVKNHATESLNNKCHYCGKKSPNLKALKSHIRYVHEMERNFKCRFCEKRFKTSRNLKDHEASVHTLEELYECSFCPRTFRNHSNMLSHRKNKHPEHYQVPIYKRDVV